MAIIGSSILKDATIAISAGTAKALSVIGQSLNEIVVFFDGTDLRTRTEATFTSKRPVKKADAPNGYTQDRKSVYLKVPLTLANGKVTVNTMQIVMATDVETTDAQKQTMMNEAAQLIIATDFANFWKSGTMG